MDKITMEFTKAEILILQELTEDVDCGFAWMQKIADGLYERLAEAYSKPSISKKVYDRAIEQERGKWKGTGLEADMVNAERIFLEFFYTVEDEDETAKETEALAEGE